jgi:uncharacterized protein with PIN domain
MRVRLRCYAELNEHLAPERRQREAEVTLTGPASLGDLVARVGIPAAEIELALVDGRSRRLDAALHEGELVSLYPVFEALDVTPVLRLRTRPLREVRFVADAHLGRLARYLRLLGFDTLFENDPGDAALAGISAEQGRILLTRDRALLERRQVTHGLWIPPTRAREQLAYLVERLDLVRLFRPFSRCTMCNGSLRAAGKAELVGQVPPRVLAVFDRFWRCRGCGRTYWEGSHYARLDALVGQVQRAAGSTEDSSRRDPMG